MKTVIKNRHYILFVLLLVIVMRISRLADISILVYEFIKSLFRDFPGTVGLLNFSLIDHFLSLLLIIILTIYFLTAGKSKSFLDSKLNFNTSVIIVLLIFFIFAPVVSTTDPDYQNNIGVTKLLPPLSRVKFIIPADKEFNNGDFGAVRNRLLNENPIYIDSINKMDGVYYYFQKEAKIRADEEILKFRDGSPVVSSRTFILGTDEFGRDIYSRLVYGTRISLIVGLGAVFVSFILGIGFGFLSGYSGWFVDTILNRFTDMFLSVPVI
ncbi:MAG TPA: hypothetical protein VI230_09225, partial [Ignavibacteriaceae bacterium]